MNEFDLRSTTALKGAELVTGIKADLLQTLAIRAVTLKLTDDYSNPALFNRSIARFIFEYYPLGVAPIKYNAKRSFSREQHEVFGLFDKQDVLVVPEINFPCPHTEEYDSLSRIAEDLVSEIHLSQQRISSELNPILEERIASTEPIRYACRGKLKIYYHRDDVFDIARQHFALKVKSLEQHVDKFSLPGWFSRARLVNLFIAHGHNLAYYTLRNIIMYARNDPEFDLKSKTGIKSGETLYYIDDPAFDYFVRTKEKVGRKKSTKLKEQKQIIKSEIKSIISKKRA